ncbi:MAG: AAA domain-containing protein [Chloroflexi bacterium]|nr:AAA domain-containing protein [Chloroflexota bacterium]
MTAQFTWIDLYQELANELIKWQDRQVDLISFLEELRYRGLVITPFKDRDEDGASFLLSEIDPFTFFGVFNRRIRNEQRIAILAEIKKFFSLQSILPESFDGIPILNNIKSWFIGYSANRDIGDVPKLWRVFELAQRKDPLNNPEFLRAFDEALKVAQTNINLTMGLFWIRPTVFLNLDSVNREYLNVKLPSNGLTSKFYIETLKETSKLGQPFFKLSHEAWLATQQNADAQSVTQKIEREDINYWLVGAYWSDSNPKDQTERFIAEGIWKNGHENKYLDDVKSMKVGDKIAIKATTTQRLGLPFDSRNKTVSLMIIKAVGTIVANRNDGRTVEVEWDTNFKEKNWYFYTVWNTVWHLKRTQKNDNLRPVEKLIDFVWYGKDQDYDWFIKNWLDVRSPDSPEETNGATEIIFGKIPYSVEDIIASGIFLEITEINQILSRLKEKKAIIIQGPPGVGKTFIARKLAYALMSEIDNDRVEFVQFHQSYSYDDFVRGYRPLPDKAGTFGIKDGIFIRFCQKAIEDPDREYVFIIDEINRGNLSQIFGELLMLIEHDKRGADYSVPLVYAQESEPRFYIPSNVYIIGLMNLADRSLAMVDYALRRRFAFITLLPKFETKQFENWLSTRSMNAELIQHIVSRLSAINSEIREDPLLGENYQIGHSYFCPKGDDFSELDIRWYQSIVKTEIVPLVKEYWFDNPRKAENAERILLN